MCQFRENISILSYSYIVCVVLCEHLCVCLGCLPVQERPLPYILPESLSVSLFYVAPERFCAQPASQFSAFTEPLIEAPQAAKKVEPCRVW